MARIFGPASGHARLRGTRGNDLIVASGDANTVIGGGGDDTIRALSGNGNVVRVGTTLDGMTNLTDFVRLDGDGDRLTGGDENVRVVGDISDSDVSLGAGYDTVLAVGSNSEFSLGGGTDTVSALGGNNSVLISGEPGVPFGTIPAYTETITFSGSHNLLDNTLEYGPYDAVGVLDVTGGSGNGTFLLGTSSGTIVTHGVDNYIQGGAYGTKIEAGNGYDTVSLLAGTHDTGGEADVLLGGTHNVVTGSEYSTSVTGGQGYDSIAFDQPAGESLLHVTDQGEHDFVSVLGAFATIDGGGSYETVSAVSSVVTMTFAGVSDALYLTGGEETAGYPSASVNDLSAGLHVYLGAYESGENYQSVGNLTINGFDATGIIDFVDGRGGFTSTAQIVSDLHATGGLNDYTLTLPDGTGTITFDNTAHLTAANFKLT